MNKKFLFLIAALWFSLSGKAQVFSPLHTGFHGVMQPVMGWIDVYHSHHPEAFVSGDYYVKDKHFVLSQLAAPLKRGPDIVPSPFPALYRGDAAVADYNHDGKEDMVITGLNRYGQPVMKLLRNDGRGHFTSVPEPFTPLSDGSVEWGDYDHDGDPDILVTGKRFDNRLATFIYRNDNGNFTEVPVHVPGVFHGVARWGDFDHDGDLDILITGNNGSGPFTALYENMKGRYFPVRVALVPLQNSDARWGDLDGDGDLDFIISGEDSEGYPYCTIYSNKQNGSFSAVPVSIRPLKSCSIDLGDYDHDGDLDIVMTGESMERSYTEVYENRLAFDFQKIVTGIPGVSNGKARWGDYDHDGDLDLLVSGVTICYDVITRIYRNNLNTKVITEKSTALSAIPVYRRGPFYYYVFSSCFCDPKGGDHPRYHLYISNIHKEKRAYDLNYQFNHLLIKTVPNWGKVDRGHRTSNAFVSLQQAETSRKQVIESYQAAGFQVHYLNW
jgi:hypothetical protein